MRKALQTLISFLMIKMLFIALVLPFSTIGLAPDEAQYWTWSQKLAWGYYSKPPAIAWEIWLGTWFFGSTEFGVRFGASILGFLIPIAIFCLAQACKLKPKTCFWAGMIMAFSPLGILSSFLATTDAGMILFWTIACYFIAKGLEEEKELNFCMVGLMIALGALFKWPIYVLWIFIFLWLPKEKTIGNKKVFLGLFISLLGLLPSFIWNSHHNWVTFRHVLATIMGGDAPQTTKIAQQGNFLEFIGAQFALLSPIFFMLFIASLKTLRKSSSLPRSLYFCGFTSLSLFTFCSFLALFQKIQGNWAIFLYPTAIVFLTWVALEKNSWGEKWLKPGLFLSLILTCFVLSLPFLQTKLAFSFPYKMNPFKHNIGWESLEKILLEAGYEPENDFLFGDKYQMTSVLSFYGPQQKRAYFLNLHGIRQNQFAYWPTMHDEQIGKTGYFVLVENSPHFEKDQIGRIKEYQKSLSQYFSKVEFVGIKPLINLKNQTVKGAFIFRGENYNGKEPALPALF